MREKNHPHQSIGVGKCEKHYSWLEEIHMHGQVHATESGV
jgi:hypothetical protein